jgi:hypothetical protein
MAHKKRGYNLQLLIKTVFPLLHIYTGQTGLFFIWSWRGEYDLEVPMYFCMTAHCWSIMMAQNGRNFLRSKKSHRCVRKTRYLARHNSKIVHRRQNWPVPKRAILLRLSMRSFKLCTESVGIVLPSAWDNLSTSCGKTGYAWIYRIQRTFTPIMESKWTFAAENMLWREQKALHSTMKSKSCACAALLLTSSPFSLIGNHPP